MSNKNMKYYCIICHKFGCTERYHREDGYHTTNKSEINNDIASLKQECKKETIKTCEEGKHDWYRHEYVGINDTNYLTCTICGKETTD
jgi:hypothetical protein